MKSLLPRWLTWVPKGCLKNPCCQTGNTESGCRLTGFTIWRKWASSPPQNIWAFSAYVKAIIYICANQGETIVGQERAMETFKGWTCGRGLRSSQLYSKPLGDLATKSQTNLKILRTYPVPIGLRSSLVRRNPQNQLNSSFQSSEWDWLWEWKSSVH